jgi:hypothetical protein
MFTVSVDAERLKNLRRNLPKLPDYIKAEGLKAVADQMNADKASITPSNSTKLPIQWTSDKQRKYVMAMLRETNNLPYKRTGEMVNSINFEYGKGGGSDYVTAETDSPYAQFVVGQYQQKFHHNTGWRALETWMTSNRRKVMGVFRDATTKAVKEFNRWMYGGAPGV